ncbi:BglG family transcription antiterminator LicT [Clostridium tertium]|uniref:BglG family transcription antiterminator LicT n=1 Tax=Clostridium tertium TaxID=1559 RepID=UPI001AEB7788|nr:PRD domain-containing protein [Clostridium tertium]MBP1867193.1 beta-glucoside operon transcriptional antiterminator [Clostridium tertium]
MKIHRILNNNVIITLDKDGEECVVCGKGLAFKKKVGDEVDSKHVNKVFVLKDQSMNEKFKQLLLNIPLDHVKIADEIIKLAETKLGKKLNDSLIISLSDHIYTSLSRYSEGIPIKNAMLWDIKRFYEDEFEIGMNALDMIEELFSVRLPDDEAGFIALHIVNAEMDESNMEQILDITRIMQEISNIVKYYFRVEFDINSVYYYRFITHLKFFAQRLVLGKTIDDRSSDGLLDVVKVKYNTSYKCVGKINEYLKSKYNYELSLEEQLYLTIHIERVIYKTKL